MDDSKIVDLYLQRNETAIQETSYRYGSRLRTLAYRIVDDWHAAEECENDTYMQAWKLIPPHEPQNYFYSFLARITRHISLNYCRDRNRLKRSVFVVELSKEMEQCIPAPNDMTCRIEQEELGRALNCFLAALDAEKRNIFLRRYWFLDSISTISKRFGYSESKVKSMLFRLRNQLRTYLIKEGYEL